MRMKTIHVLFLIIFVGAVECSHLSVQNSKSNFDEVKNLLAKPIHLVHGYLHGGANANSVSTSETDKSQKSNLPKNSTKNRKLSQKTKNSAKEMEHEEKEENGQKRALGYLLLALLVPQSLKFAPMAIGKAVGQFGTGINSNRSQSATFINDKIHWKPIYGQLNQAIGTLKIPMPDPEQMQKMGLFMDIDGQPAQLEEIGQFNLQSCARPANGQKNKKIKGSRKNLSPLVSNKTMDSEHKREIVCEKVVNISAGELTKLRENGNANKITPPWRQIHQQQMQPMNLKNIKKGNGTEENLTQQLDVTQRGPKTTFTVINNCDYHAWPNVIAGDARYNNGRTPEDWRFPNLEPHGGKASIQVLSDVKGLNIQIMMDCKENGTGCTSAACKDVNGNSIACPLGQQGSNPKTQFEWTLGGGAGADFYDVSFVNGQNVVGKITPIGGPSSCQVVPGCSLLSIADKLPKELVTRDPNGFAYLVDSLCDVHPTDDSLCCAGAYSQPEQCHPIYGPGGKAADFYRIENEACPDEYTYPYDDKAGTKTCDMTQASASGYNLELCPNPN